MEDNAGTYTGKLDSLLSQRRDTDLRHQGLKHIHDHNFLHLDLKPANILITFEGMLKIADFGMATKWPAAPGIEGEGDRGYIAPEVLRGHYDKPVDVFALGLIVLEIAANSKIPDNGRIWQELRNGDLSSCGSLSWTSEMSTIVRDSSGVALNPDQSNATLCDSDDGDDEFGSPGFLKRQRKLQQKHKREPVNVRSGELLDGPDFMIDPSNESSVDRIVRQMISPRPQDRPVLGDLLQTAGMRWVQARRRAGATVYEGNFGPADEVLQDDAEMIDV